MHLDYIETVQSYCLLSICSASKWDNILQNVIIFEPCWTLLQVSLVSATPSEVITTESLTPGLGARRDKWGCIYSTRPARYSSWRERGKSGALTSHPASSCHLTCVQSVFIPYLFPCGSNFLDKKRQIRVHLLNRACQIFLMEGERQIRSADIASGQ